MSKYDKDAARLISGCESMGQAKVEAKLPEAPTKEHERCLEYAIMYMGGLMDYGCAVACVSKSIQIIREGNEER